MYGVSRRYLNGDDAQDCVVMAFTKVFQSIGKFTWMGDGSLESWIRRIVINEALMWLRKNHNFNLTERIEAGSSEPDLSDVAQLESQEIAGMISRLPVGYRTVFSLFVIEGFTHEEIGKLLAINESTSRSQLFKAKSLLKKMLLKGGYHYGTYN
jgi:RNA polymerase sigma factor (sigma-70 family)